ncbi:MAG: HD domain-containing protein [Pseudomonadota bacterium]|jgi:predicted hydrolase (HD superfamily)
MKTRQEAQALLSEYTKSASLLTHALAVEACMVWYADYFSQQGHNIEREAWAITGLLHDFDYEMYPEPTSPDGHPFKGNSILAELGYPEDIRTAIMGHAVYTNTPRKSLLDKTLFAVDELSGLITASVYVRPDRSIENLEVKSVLKKFKDKAFARRCNRDDIRVGAEELGIPLEQHVANCITAMKPLAARLAA